jgi:hypothetical protein
MLSEQSEPLTFPSYKRTDDEGAFSGDKFGRRALAERLTSFLPRLSKNGAVIAIDAPWGAGKSWFGANWASELRKSGHKVAFLNAFEQDHTEDPFLPITAELSQLLQGNSGSAKFREKALQVACAVLPGATKLGLSFAGRWLLGVGDLPKKIEDIAEKMEEKSEQFVQHWVEKKIEDYVKEKASLTGFRDALGEMAKSEGEGRPVVVFIDELDRCRPDFAVRLIERIKHFFDTPNVVFILLINREQLERAVQGVYGGSTDGAAYLSKFIHFFFSLPHTAADSFIKESLIRLGVKMSMKVDSFVHLLAMWRVAAQLSLRDIERAAALYAYASVNDMAPLLSYLIVLKIRRPDIYARFLENDVNCNKEAKNWISEIRSKHRLNNSIVPAEPYLSEIFLMHDVLTEANQMAVASGLKIILPEQTSKGQVSIQFHQYLRVIDLPIE